MIVLIGGEKGGTGKTTLAVNLAAARAKGRDVLLVDTDKQGSATGWAAVRAAEQVEPPLICVSKFGEGFSVDVRKMAPKYDDVLIDAGGRDNLELRMATTIAHRMLIPARTGQFDIESLSRMDEMVGQARAFNEKLDAVVVVNCAPTHPTMADAEVLLTFVREKAKNLRVLDAVVRDRSSFRRSVADGRAVMEMNPQDEKAVFELMHLYKEVFRDG